MDKNLPIQIVKTRGKQDVFKKEGSGGELPKWVTREVINSHKTAITHTLDTISTLFDNEPERELPVLVTATLYDKATAKTYRPNIRAIFNQREKQNLIGSESVNKLIVKIDNKADLLLMKKNVRGARSKEKECGIAAIISINRLEPHVEEGTDSGAIKVRLVDYKDECLNKKAEEVFKRECQAMGVECEALNYAPSLILYGIESSSSEIVQSLATMDSVISVKRMPYVEISASVEEYNTLLDIKKPQDGEEYPLVGVMDSGVEDIPHLSPWRYGNEQNVVGLDDEDINRRHGTAVTGIILYGDGLQDEKLTGCNPAKYVSCIVNTDSGLAAIQEKEMVMYIRKAVEENPEVKVWNLSQGSTEVIEDDAFSEFGMALDSIQKEYGVLICKSAGNRLSRGGSLKLCKGADSTLALVVGSIAHEKHDATDAEVGQRSPFSKIGYGPEFLIKPDVVQYGGNMTVGVKSFSETGFESSAFKGTSFSTPRISALAADLAFRLGGTFNREMIKALIVHSAYYPNLSGMNEEDILKELGHGLPRDIDSILNNDQDEFTYVLPINFKPGEDFQIQDVPFPEGMVDDDGFFYGDITVTLVSEPELKASEGSEYCQSDVEVLLQTYRDVDYVLPGAVGVSPTYRNTDRLVEPQNILAKSLYSKKSFKIRNGRERTLIESGFKYQPVKKYHVDLEDMTKTNKEKFLIGNRRWCLRINASYRDAIAQESGTLSTKAVVIVTIKDNRHQGLAYAQGVHQLDLYHFEHVNIIVNQQVNVDNGI